MVLCPRCASESSASCFKPRIGEYLEGKRAIAYWVKSQRFPVWGYLGPSVLDALVYFQCLQIDVFYFDIFTCSQRQHWCTTTQSITLEHLETQNYLTPDFTCWQVSATGHGLLPWCAVMGWCLCLPKTHVSQCMVFGCGGSGRWPGHKRDQCSHDREPKSSLTLYSLWGHNEKMAMSQEAGPYKCWICWTLILDFLPPQPRNIKSCCL